MAGMWLYNYDKLLPTIFSGVKSNYAYGSETEKYDTFKSRSGTWYEPYYKDGAYTALSFPNGIKSDALKLSIDNNDSTGYWRIGIMEKDFMYDYYTYNLDFTNNLGAINTLYDNKVFENRNIKRNIKVSIPCMANMTVYGFAIAAYPNSSCLIYIEKLSTPQEFQQGDNIIIEITQTFPTVYQEA